MESYPTGPSAPDLDAGVVAAAERRGRRRRVLIGAAAGAAVLIGIGAVVAVRSGKLEQEPKVWPAEVGGRPGGLGATGETAAEVTPSADPGVYLWNDFDGWHLWVVPGEDLVALTGTITSDVDLTSARLSAPGTGTVAVDGDTVTFDVSDPGAVAGVDFEPGFYAERVEVALEGPDGPVDPALVRVGGEPAAEMPVVVEKVVDPAAAGED